MRHSVFSLSLLTFAAACATGEKPPSMTSAEASEETVVKVGLLDDLARLESALKSAAELYGDISASAINADTRANARLAQAEKINARIEKLNGETSGTASPISPPSIFSAIRSAESQSPAEAISRSENYLLSEISQILATEPDAQTRNLLTDIQAEIEADITATAPVD